jgi:hypothetical protein
MISIKQRIRDIVPMSAYRILQYYYWHRRLPNLISPKTFNEKLCKRMIAERDPQMTLWADKFAVRDFVRQRAGDKYLPKLYADYSEPNAIYNIELPERFVLKPNNGSGRVYLHNGAHAPNLERLAGLSAEWLGRSYYYRSKEWAYKDIAPRVLVEEYLGSGLQPPVDFKFFCFGGVAKIVQVDFDRYINHKRNMYDRDWTLLDCEYGYQSDRSRVFSKPEGFDLMIELAEKLSAGSKFIRIDLYCIDNDIRFGEITNYPEGGSKRFKPESWDLVLGQMWPS